MIDVALCRTDGRAATLRAPGRALDVQVVCAGLQAGVAIVIAGAGFPRAASPRAFARLGTVDR